MSGQMEGIVARARMREGLSIALVSPNRHSLQAIDRAIEEGVIGRAFLVYSTSEASEVFPERHLSRYTSVCLARGEDDPERAASEKAVALVREGQAAMIMKGKINTAPFMRAVLNKATGIGTKRRLSLVTLFEPPGLGRLIFLSDPAINPGLIEEGGVARDIIENAIEVARAMGVPSPKVALLEANERPSKAIPSSLVAARLAEQEWGGVVVQGPLSYDLALYPESAAHKGISHHSVAGKADILIVPHIAGGNFLYKAFTMTFSLEMASVTVGARAPIIMTSRSDSEINKFLTICASSLLVPSPS